MRLWELMSIGIRCELVLRSDRSSVAAEDGLRSGASGIPQELATKG